MMKKNVNLNSDTIKMSKKYLNTKRTFEKQQSFLLFRPSTVYERPETFLKQMYTKNRPYEKQLEKILTIQIISSSSQRDR